MKKNETDTKFFRKWLVRRLLDQLYAEWSTHGEELQINVLKTISQKIE
jgi:hypothetical protein